MYGRNSIKRFTSLEDSTIIEIKAKRRNKHFGGERVTVVDSVVRIAFTYQFYPDTPGASPRREA